VRMDGMEATVWRPCGGWREKVAERRLLYDNRGGAPSTPSLEGLRDSWQSGPRSSAGKSIEPLAASGWSVSSKITRKIMHNSFR
jgi:hypothetical protein